MQGWYVNSIGSIAIFLNDPENYAFDINMGFTRFIIIIIYRWLPFSIVPRAVK